jgi:hypothetical protein
MNQGGNLKVFEKIFWTIWGKKTMCQCFGEAMNTVLEKNDTIEFK